MKRVVTTFILTVFLAAAVTGLAPERLEQAEISFTANHSFSYERQPDSMFESLTATMTWLPMSTTTQSADTSVENGEIEDDEVVVERTRPDSFTTSITSRIVSDRNEPRIEDPTPFPFDSVDQSLVRSQSKYLQSTELINVTPRIRGITTDVVAEEETLRGVVDTVAAWTSTNIEYNLSTTNAEANLPSDQVLAQRNGVCDEITNLFIAQLRSLGIPARYVSGVAYTESDLFDSRWGAHSWAEVYFPGEGWVPYDPTYQQFGYVDATHVAFNKGVEAEKYGTSYQWRAQGVTPSYDRDWAVDLERTTNSSSDIGLAVDVAEQSIGFEGSNVVEADVVNDESYYQSVRVVAHRTEKLGFDGERMRAVTVEPDSTRRVTWGLNAEGPFQDGFEYTMPVHVSADGVDEQRSFMIERGAGTRDVERGEAVAASCSATNKSYRPGDRVRITCDVPRRTQACVGSRCGDRSANPSVSVTAPTVSETERVELPGLDETVFVSVPVVTEPSVVDVRGVYNAEEESLNVSYDLRRGHAADEVRLVVSEGDAALNVSAPKNSSGFVESFAPGWSANITGSVTVGEERVPMDVTVVDDRGVMSRLMDWAGRTIMSLNPFS